MWLDSGNPGGGGPAELAVWLEVDSVRFGLWGAAIGAEAIWEGVRQIGNGFDGSGALLGMVNRLSGDALTGHPLGCGDSSLRSPDPARRLYLALHRMSAHGCGTEFAFQLRTDGLPGLVRTELTLNSEIRLPYLTKVTI